LAPGTPVQYIAEDGQPEASLVVADHGEDCKTLMVFHDLEVGESGIERKTSILRGEEPGHWRPIPQEGG
jgi:hypothetical protein